MFVVWLKDVKLQNLLSGRRANIQATVKVVPQAPLGTVNMTLGNSVIMRVCMGIRTNITIV